MKLYKLQAQLIPRRRGVVRIGQRGACGISPAGKALTQEPGDAPCKIFRNLGIGSVLKESKKRTPDQVGAISSGAARTPPLPPASCTFTPPEQSHRWQGQGLPTRPPKGSLRKHRTDYSTLPKAAASHLRPTGPLGRNAPYESKLKETQLPPPQHMPSQSHAPQLLKLRLGFHSASAPSGKKTRLSSAASPSDSPPSVHASQTKRHRWVPGSYGFSLAFPDGGKEPPRLSGRIM